MARLEAAEILRQEAARDSLRRQRTRFDGATPLGMLAAFALVIVAMSIGGAPRSFVDIPSILIVIGGTFGITIVSFTLSELGQAGRAISKTVLHRVEPPQNAAETVLELSGIARRNGTLALQAEIDLLGDRPFAERAFSMIVDGIPVEDVEAVLQRDLREMVRRHAMTVGVLRRAAEVSPAMGLIGTLIGLIQMLGNLQDPSAIGPNMAIALLTTFYGAVLASMVFQPLATKLERRSAQEALVASIYLLAAGSIGRKENPRQLEQVVNALLPPGQRVQMFD